MARHSYPDAGSNSTQLLGRAALGTIIVPVVMTIVVSGCAAAVHPSAGPVPLHLAAGRAAGAPMAASGVVGPGGYVLSGTLPTTPTSAPIYRWLSGGTLADTAAVTLGKAFGVFGTPQRHAYGWVLTSSVGEVRLRDGAGGQWSLTTSNNCGFGGIDVDSPGNVGTGSCAVATAVAAPPGTPSPLTSDPATSPTQIPVDPPIVPEPLARSIADPVLAALGVTGTEIVYPGPGVSQVQVDPKLDGYPTQGMATVFQVDQNSVVAANGWLVPPTAGDAYPLITADAAFKDLANRPMLQMGIACPTPPDPTATVNPCPTPTPVAITGGELGLSMNWDQSGGPLLVPAWFFTVADSTEPLVQIAVDPAYLATPTPTDKTGVPGGGASLGSGGSPGTIIPPGTPGVVPTNVAPTSYTSPTPA